MPSVQLPKKEALIVDDDVRARELLSEFCRGQGFGVATAHHGQAAIAAITRDPGPLAVLIPDRNVPGADSFDVVGSPADQSARLSRDDHRIRHHRYGRRCRREGAYAAASSNG